MDGNGFSPFEPKAPGILGVLGVAALLSQLSQGYRKVARGAFDPIRNGFERIDLSSCTNSYHLERVFDEFDEPGRFSFCFLFAAALRSD